MARVDFDGTASPGNKAYEFARHIGKGKEAKDIYSKLSSKCERIVREGKDQSRMISTLDDLYLSTIDEGVKLIRDVPVSRIEEIQYPTTKKFPKIVEMSKKEGSLHIGTLNHEGFVEKFIERNKEMLPCNCKIAVSSKFKEYQGYFTGEIERYSGIESKMNSYDGGIVFANGISDIGVCFKANRLCEKIYIVNGAEENILHENILLEETLEKFRVPFSYL